MRYLLIILLLLSKCKTDHVPGKQSMKVYVDSTMLKVGKDSIKTDSLYVHMVVQRYYQKRDMWIVIGVGVVEIIVVLLKK